MKRGFVALIGFIISFFTANEALANYEIEYCICGYTGELTYSCHYPDPYGCETPVIRHCCYDY